MSKQLAKIKAPLFIGAKLGKLTLLSETRKSGRVHWVCKCECGKTTCSQKFHLQHGNTKSCGCIRGLHRRTHGLSSSSEHKIWSLAKDRCGNPKNKRFDRYGGRGIKMCDRWLNSFANFFADMGPRPSPQHSIDRYPNNDGNYEPGNCRWATRKEQAHHRVLTTHFQCGHLISPENTYQKGGGRRYCRPCRIERDRRRWQPKQSISAQETV